jgi:5-(carboxyamino)imidazole ribonucleotide mutase
MPSGVTPAVVLEPKNAALLAAKMLALANPDLRQKVKEVQDTQRQRLLDADAQISAVQT